MSVTDRQAQQAAILSCALTWRAVRSAVERMPVDQDGFFESFDAVRPRLARKLGDQYLAFLEDAYAVWFTHVYVDHDPSIASGEGVAVEPIFAIVSGPQNQIDRLVNDCETLLAGTHRSDRAVALVPWSFVPADIERLSPRAIIEALAVCGNAPQDDATLPVPTLDDLLILRDRIATTRKFARADRVLMIGISLVRLGPECFEETVAHDPDRLSTDTPDTHYRAHWIEGIVRSCAPALSVEAYPNPMTALRAFREPS